MKSGMMNLSCYWVDISILHMKGQTSWYAALGSMVSVLYNTLHGLNKFHYVVDEIAGFNFVDAILHCLI